MKLRYLIAAALCVLALPASAYWQSRDSNYNKSISGAAAYSGPGDVVSGALAWWGLRAYSAATRGTKAVNVCIPADATCADLSTDASTGVLVITTIGGSSCSVVTCTIKTFYDQSGTANCAGACDITQATIGSRYVLTVSCINGLPCGDSGVVSSDQYSNTGFAAQAQPFTVSTVAMQTSAAGGISTIAFSSNQSVQALLDTGQQVSLYAGALPSSVGTVLNNVFHALQFIGNGASSSIYADGSSLALGSTIGAFGLGGTTGIGANGNGCTCKFTEGGFWAGNFNGTQQSNMNSNQTSFWGPF